MTLPYLPTRSSSLTSDSSNDDDSVGTDEGHTPPSITAIYNDAEAYDKVLLSAIHRDSRDSDPDIPESRRTGYNHLVIDDLTPSERADIGQATKLAVTGDTWTPGNLTEEPEPYDEDDGSSQDTAVHAIIESSPIPTFHRPATMDTDSWKLEPQKIVELLVNEFGSLTEGEDKPEKLILESDGCMFNGVVILVRLSRTPLSRPAYLYFTGRRPFNHAPSGVSRISVVFRSVSDGSESNGNQSRVCYNSQEGVALQDARLDRTISRHDGDMCLQQRRRSGPAS